MIVFFSGIVFGFCGCDDVPEKRQDIIRALPPLQGGKVNWRKWAARDSARVSGRPLFLFLFTQRSVWCRDLVARCFDNAELARIIERQTWPIWVDADLRPDLFERFSMGGVPSLVFLTPAGEWITGSTYLDPRDLADLLRRVQILFANPERLETLEEQRAELLRREGIYRQKNPRPSITPGPVLLQRVQDSLKSVVRRGLDPGPEGLLALAEAGIDSPLIRFAKSAQRDTDGVYVLATLTQRGPVLDREKHLGVNAAILSALAQVGLSGDLADALLAQFAVPDDILLAAGLTGFHDDLGRSLQDSRVFVSWNALAVSGLCAAYGDTGDRRYLKAGRDIFEALKGRFLAQNGLFYHHAPADGPSLLQDQVLMIRAGLDLFDAEGQKADLLFAHTLADLVIENFSDPSGGLRDWAPQTGAGVMSVVDRWVPAGNGVAAQVMIRLYTHTKNGAYRDAAKDILTGLIGPNIDRAGYAGAMNRALAMYIKRSEGI